MSKELFAEYRERELHLYSEMVYIHFKQLEIEREYQETDTNNTKPK